jgi:hypothetical protein
VTDFGDHEPADAYDTAAADPEQVARRLHELRRRDGLESVPWDELSKPHRARIVMVVAALLAWGRREGWMR